MGASQSAQLSAATNATAGGFCFAQKTPMTFHWYETAVHPHYVSDVKGFPDWVRNFDRKSLSPHGDDFLLENLNAFPHPSELTAPTDDEDAIALQEKLHELANRDVEDLGSAYILATVPAYGVGATISSMIYPILEALAQDATLFAPKMSNWTSPSCESRDLTCYFSSLPSWEDHLKRRAAKLQRRSRHASSQQQVRAQTQMLQRLRSPLHNDTTETLCDAVKGLGMGCPKLLKHAAHAEIDRAAARRAPAASSFLEVGSSAKSRAKGSSQQAALQPAGHPAPQQQQPAPQQQRAQQQQQQQPSAEASSVSEQSVEAQRKRHPGPTISKARALADHLEAELADMRAKGASKEKIDEHRFAIEFDHEIMDLVKDRKADKHQLGISSRLSKTAAETWATPLGIKKGQYNIGARGEGLAAFFGEAQYNENTLVSRIPHRFLRRGRFWLLSQVIYFLTRPNDRLRARLDSERALLSLEKPVLGLHVRKGDACGDRGECRELEDYMPTVTRMIRKYGYKSVFLATPDPTVLKDVDDFPDVNFQFLPTTNTTTLMKENHYRKIDDAIKVGAVDAGNEFDEAMISAYLLAEADGFIGGFSSNAARVAYSMMAAGPQGCLKPYDSFDINWCAAFGKGGPAVLRRGNESCYAAQGRDKKLRHLPCMIGC